MLATNLHADDLDEARELICTDNLVPASHFNACKLALFVRMKHCRRDTQRRVEKVYVSDGISPHTLVFDGQAAVSPVTLRNDDSVEKEWISRCQGFLEDALQSNVRTIEETRTWVVRFLGTC